MYCAVGMEQRLTIVLADCDDVLIETRTVPCADQPLAARALAFPHSIVTFANTTSLAINGSTLWSQEHNMVVQRALPKINARCSLTFCSHSRAATGRLRRQRFLLLLHEALVSSAARSLDDERPILQPVRCRASRGAPCTCVQH